MKHLKFFLIILLVSLTGALAGAAGTQRDTVRILAIGNSFSEDAVEQNLHEIGMADGRVLIVGNMYIGGCSLARHLKNARENIADYAYRKVGADGVKVNRKGTTLEYALSDEHWDYVSFQQQSAQSGHYDTFVETLPELYAYVKERTSPDTEFMLFQTWAYAWDCTTNEGFKDYDYNQDRMYESIVDAYNRAAKLVKIKTIIPCGTAIQNARTSFIGDHMNRDGYHLNKTYGRFTAACTWYEKIFGGIMDNTYAPEGLPADYIEVAHRAAHEAVRHPDKVTGINVEPIGPGTSVGETRDTVRLLCIGNSFSEDAVEQYLGDMVRANGRVLIIGNMYIGGCYLERHLNNARDNAPAYSYRKIGADGEKVTRTETTLEYALGDEHWDYISFQQNATYSIDFKSYSDFLPELFQYVKDRSADDTQYIFHQSWAYRFDPPSKYTGPFDEDQMKMYSCLVDCGNRACELVGISILIPTASAIQSARTTFIGDNINRDALHVDKLYGRFTLACTWYEKLYGNVLNNRYVPKGLTSDYEKIARLAAYSAVRNPDSVTQIDVKQLPVPESGK